MNQEGDHNRHSLRCRRTDQNEGILDSVTSLLTDLILNARNLPASFFFFFLANHLLQFLSQLTWCSSWLFLQNEWAGLVTDDTFLPNHKEDRLNVIRYHSWKDRSLTRVSDYAGKRRGLRTKNDETAYHIDTKRRTSRIHDIHLVNPVDTAIDVQHKELRYRTPD